MGAMQSDRPAAASYTDRWLTQLQSIELDSHSYQLRANRAMNYAYSCAACSYSGASHAFSISISYASAVARCAAGCPTSPKSAPETIPDGLKFRTFPWGGMPRPL